MIIPKEVANYVDNSLLFNKFGVINLKAVRGITKTTLTDEELKEAINEHFGKEFSNGIEYL